MVAISQGVYTRDGAAVHEGAERLKQLLDSLGAPEAIAIAEEVGRCGRDGEFARAKMLVIVLRRNVDQLIATVKTWPPLTVAA